MQRDESNTMQHDASNAIVMQLRPYDAWALDAVVVDFSKLQTLFTHTGRVRMTEVFLQFNLKLICLRTSWCQLTFIAFHCFFLSPASKHRVRDEINQSQKSVFLIKNRSHKSVFLIKHRSQKSVFLIKHQSQKSVFLIKNRSQNSVYGSFLPANASWISTQKKSWCV